MDSDELVFVGLMHGYHGQIDYYTYREFRNAIIAHKQSVQQYSPLWNDNRLDETTMILDDGVKSLYPTQPVQTVSSANNSFIQRLKQGLSFILTGAPPTPLISQPPATKPVASSMYSTKPVASSIYSTKPVGSSMYSTNPTYASSNMGKPFQSSFSTGNGLYSNPVNPPYSAYDRGNVNTFGYESSNGVRDRASIPSWNAHTFHTPRSNRF